MDTVGKRLSFIRQKILKVTQAEFSRLIGVSQGALSAMEHDSRGLPMEVIISLFEYSRKSNYTFSVEWLLTGENPKQHISSDKDQKILKLIESIPNAEKEKVIWALSFMLAYQNAPRSQDNIIPFTQDFPPSSKLRSLKVFDMPSSAGTGLYLDSDDYTTMDFDSDIIPHGADFGVRIRGDSMIPFVDDDDIVFVKSQPELEDGEIGIVVLNNSALCKKYCVRDGKVLLVSLNQKYEPIEIEEYDELHFVGKVVGRVTPEENTKGDV